MSIESGNMYTCDICGKQIFISNRDLTLEGGLRKLGVHKAEISGMLNLYHICHDCFKDLGDYLSKKKESFKCSEFCPNKEAKE